MRFGPGLGPGVVAEDQVSPNPEAGWRAGSPRNLPAGIAVAQRGLLPWLLAVQDLHAGFRIPGACRNPLRGGRLDGRQLFGREGNVR